MKKRIRIIGENISFNIGDVVEVDVKRAERAIKAGLAEYVGQEVAVTVEDASVPSVSAPAIEEVAAPALTLEDVVEKTDFALEDIEVIEEVVVEAPAPKKKAAKKK